MSLPPLLTNKIGPLPGYAWVGVAAAGTYLLMHRKGASVAGTATVPGAVASPGSGAGTELQPIVIGGGGSSGGWPGYSIPTSQQGSAVAGGYSTDGSSTTSASSGSSPVVYGAASVPPASSLAPYSQSSGTGVVRFPNIPSVTQASAPVYNSAVTSPSPVTSSGPTAGAWEQNYFNHLTPQEQSLIRTESPSLLNFSGQTYSAPQSAVEANYWSHLPTNVQSTIRSTTPGMVRA